MEKQIRFALTAHDTHGNGGNIATAKAVVSDLMTDEKLHAIINGDFAVNRPTITVDPVSPFRLVKFYYGMGSEVGARGNGFENSAQAEAGLKAALREICGDEFEQIDHLVDIATVRGHGCYPKPIHNGTYFSWLSKCSPNLKRWIICHANEDNRALLAAAKCQWGSECDVTLNCGNGEYGSVIGYEVDSPMNWDKEVLALVDPLLDDFRKMTEAEGWTVVNLRPLSAEPINATIIGEGWFRRAREAYDWAIRNDRQDEIIREIIECVPQAENLIVHYPPLFAEEWYKDPRHAPDLPSKLTREFGEIVSIILEHMDFQTVFCAHLHNQETVIEKYAGTTVVILGLGKSWTLN